MALIKCTKCGHEVSDKAPTCPKCGCLLQNGGSLNVNGTSVNPLPSKTKKSKIWIWFVLLLFLLVGGGYYAFTKFPNNKGDKNAIVELTPDFIKSVQQYDMLTEFSEGYAAVRKGDKWGFIDTKGNEVIPVNIDAKLVYGFSEGLAFVFRDDETFDVIDTKGNLVFDGKGDFYESQYFGAVVHGFAPIPHEASQLPRYLQGKLYVPSGAETFVIYDREGKKIGEISREAKLVLDEQYANEKDYRSFTKKNGNADGFQWETVGLRDDKEREVVPAIYDEIVSGGYANGVNNEKIESNNGVVVVVLHELDEDAFTMGPGYGTIRYYGFADLKGNDTFSEDVKERCKKSKEQGIKYFQE